MKKQPIIIIALFALLILSLVVPVKALTLNDSLQYYLKMDENSHTIIDATGKSGFNETGNNLFQGVGKINFSHYTIGTNNNWVFYNNSPANLTPNFTVSMWINWSGDGGSQGNDVTIFLFKNQTHRFQLYSLNDGSLFFQAGSDSGQSEGSFGSPTIADKQYHNLVLKREGGPSSSSCTLYIDNVNISTQGCDYTNGLDISTPGTLYACAGVGPGCGSGTHNVDGHYDAVAYWSRTLSNNEVGLVYFNGTNGTDYPFQAQAAGPGPATTNFTLTVHVNDSMNASPITGFCAEINNGSTTLSKCTATTTLTQSLYNLTYTVKAYNMTGYSNVSSTSFNLTADTTLNLLASPIGLSSVNYTWTFTVNESQNNTALSTFTVTILDLNNGSNIQSKATSIGTLTFNTRNSTYSYSIDNMTGYNGIANTGTSIQSNTVTREIASPTSVASTTCTSAANHVLTILIQLFAVVFILSIVGAELLKRKGNDELGTKIYMGAIIVLFLTVFIGVLSLLTC